ncbi:MAG: HdeD family acid-resistance protein [Lachnospiraceae bacterium]
MRNLKTVKNVYVVMTICCIVGGTTLFVWPGLGLDVLCRIYGVFFLVYGLAKLSSYFTKDLFQLAFQFDFGLGIVSIILGALMIFRTDHFVVSLAFCIGIFMLTDAALKIQTAFEAKRFGIDRWKWILITAIAAGIIGAFLLLSPMKTTNYVVRMVGLGICLDGVMNLVVVLNTVKTMRISQKEIIDID